MRAPLLAFLSSVFVFGGCGSSTPTKLVGPCGDTPDCVSLPSGATTKEIEEAFVTVKPSGTIVLGEGTFAFTKSINLEQAGVTVRGAGMNKTILDFTNQIAGEDGILVTGDHFTIEDLQVLNAKGNGIKVTGTKTRFLKGATFRRVAGVWSAKESKDNGKYALYPVLCEDVLMEDCLAEGSSDAGIYVGQSKNIIVRRNHATGNVAGLEIENSIGADVYENVVTGNAAGLLAFGLTHLVQNNQRVRLYNNIVKDNNLQNFAGGGIVGKIPGGTGVVLMSSAQIEFFGNTVENNDSAGLAVVSLCLPETAFCNDDAAMAADVLDPFPRQVYVHDNTFANNGTDAPSHFNNKYGEQSDLAAILTITFGTDVPTTLYDGLFAPPKGVAPADWMPTSATNPMEICFANNTGASFSNLDANTIDPNTGLAPHANDPANTDIGVFTCTPSFTLDPITIEGVE